MIRRRVRFAGRVQGVGFRATTRSIARGFLVSGWVRNEPDGSVLLEVQGESDEVDRFLVTLRDRMAGFIRSERGEATNLVEGEAGFEIAR